MQAKILSAKVCIYPTTDNTEKYFVQINIDGNWTPIGVGGKLFLFDNRELAQANADEIMKQCVDD